MMKRVIACQPTMVKGLRAFTTSRASFDAKPEEPKQPKKKDTSGRYLHKSLVNSYIFQNSLLPLPIPKLEDSLDRYLDTLLPLGTAEEFQATRKVVEDFKTGEGAKLHEMMVAENKANKNTSYISKPWFEMYFKARDPLPINFTPYIGFAEDPNPLKNPPINRLSCLIYSSLRFKATLEDQVLKPEIFHMKPKNTDTDIFWKIANYMPDKFVSYYAMAQSAFPLDMSQYKNLFCSTRLPRLNEDRLALFPKARHLVVMYKHRFYEFDVIKEDGSFASVDEIKANLTAIQKDERPALPTSQSAGLFTTMNRDDWAIAREEFTKTVGNAKSLERIDSAVFLISLDDLEFKTDVDKSRNALFGTGRNRWFDKSFSLVTDKSGEVAINFEHSWGDGVCILRYMNEVYADANSLDVPSENPGEVAAKEISFHFSDSTSKTLEKAGKDFDGVTNSLNFELSRNIGPVGKEALKKYNMGSDALCQFSFQLGYYRLFGKTAATYESANTAAFKHGRTETIRPNTLETLNASRAFLNPNATIAEKYHLLQKVNTKHNALVKNALTGQGFDRHLFKLKNIAEKNNMPLHDFYTAGGVYQKMNHNILSTSTLQSESIASGGFGPVVKDGFGLGYSIYPDCLGLHITSYTSDAPALLEAIDKSLYEILDVLHQHEKK